MRWPRTAVFSAQGAVQVGDIDAMRASSHGSLASERRAGSRRDQCRRSGVESGSIRLCRKKRSVRLTTTTTGCCSKGRSMRSRSASPRRRSRESGGNGEEGHRPSAVPAFDQRSGCGLTDARSRPGQRWKFSCPPGRPVPALQAFAARAAVWPTSGSATLEASAAAQPAQRTRTSTPHSFPCP